MSYGVGFMAESHLSCHRRGPGDGVVIGSDCACTQADHNHPPRSGLKTHSVYQIESRQAEALNPSPA